MNNRVIYTALTGGYDGLMQPHVIYPGYDYICFTDNPKTERDGVWEFRPIPYDSNDRVVLSRYPKLNPHEVLKEYEYSVYIDANIEILDDYLLKCVEDKIERGVLLALANHHERRKDVYDEAAFILKKRFAKFSEVLRQIKFLREEGYPENQKFYENNVIFRRHLKTPIIDLDKLWWNAFLSFTKRDQLSLCYCYWKLNIPLEGLFDENFLITYDSNILHLRRMGHNLSEKITLLARIKYKLIYLSKYDEMRLGCYRFYLRYISRLFD